MHLTRTPAMPPALAPGVTVVTVNNRLARALSAAHATVMLARGAQAWETPRVLPFGAFVAGEWAAAREAAREPLPRLLDAVEQRALWLSALTESGTGTLLSPGAAAANAAEARDLLARHEARLVEAEWRDHPDAREFARWHARFEHRLAAGGWVDPPAAATRLAALVREGVARAPPALRFAGFDALTPQHETLLDAYRRAGTRVTVDTAPDTPPRAGLAVFESPEDEIEAAARWARALLEAGATGPIGVVVPDLEARLDSVEAIFEDVLHPCTTVAPSPGTGARAFNVSLGRRLAGVPVVAHALAALETSLGVAPVEAAGTLLMSPYLPAAHGERAQRLALEVRLRDEGVREIRGRRLARLAVRGGSPVFGRRLAEACALAPHPRARRPLAEHSRVFAGVLAALGWPGGRVLDSGEYQAADALREQIRTLGAAGLVTGPGTNAYALALLARMLAETTFRPRAAPAPVQVLGVLEAAGATFPHLWVTGMHDAAWPPAQAPNALLPIALQRRHAMPGVAPEQTLARARRITARLLCAAPEPVVSHARARGEEILRASPLVAMLPVIDPVALPRSTSALADAALASTAVTLERIEDWHARAVGHGWRARGGSRVLTDQAACPFRAFARHRLGASGVARAPAPLDARSRGTLAHRLMQALFGGLADRDAIRRLDTSARETLAGLAAKEAVAAVLRRHPGEVPARLADAERDRLRALALRWLEVEAARAPFRVEAIEQRRVVRVGGLTLDVQLDRVDRVEGGRLLLDYKTGRVDRGAWFGERPDEPQLPLYALALDAEGGAAAPVGAVCFASLRRGAERYEGIAESPEWAPGLTPLGTASLREFADIAALKSHWARVLGELAEAFAGGDALLDPKPQACRWCEMRALCRIDAVRGPAGGEDA